MEQLWYVVVAMAILVLVRDIIVYLVRWQHDRRLKAIMKEIDTRTKINEAILSGLRNGNILDLRKDDDE